MSYRLTGYNSVIRLSDSAAIPFDLLNCDYKVYLAWMAKGNVPEPASSNIPKPVAP